MATVVIASSWAVRKMRMAISCKVERVACQQRLQQGSRERPAGLFALGAERGGTHAAVGDHELLERAAMAGRLLPDVLDPAFRRGMKGVSSYRRERADKRRTCGWACPASLRGRGLPMSAPVGQLSPRAKTSEGDRDGQGRLLSRPPPMCAVQASMGVMACILGRSEGARGGRERKVKGGRSRAVIVGPGTS